MTAQVGPAEAQIRVTLQPDLNKKTNTYKCISILQNLSEISNWNW